MVMPKVLMSTSAHFKRNDKQWQQQLFNHIKDDSRKLKATKQNRRQQSPTRNRGAEAKLATGGVVPEGIEPSS